MSDQLNFFDVVNHKDIIINFANRIARARNPTSFPQKRNIHIFNILISMSKHEDWNKSTQSTIKWVGSSFINLLSVNQEAISDEQLNNVYAFCFRFLLELYLKSAGDLNHELERARQFAFSNIENFSGDSKEHIQYACYQLPLDLIKEAMSSDGMNGIREFNSYAAAALKEKENWESDFVLREKRVAALKDNLEKYENAFNFVALYAGFKNLWDEKTNEKKTIRRWSIFFGFLIILPIIAEISFIFINYNSIDSVLKFIGLSSIPIISLILVFVYFFRLLMFNFKSVKSQLLQIELRMTLCQFIQSYIEYAKDFKEKDKDLLSRFESIIFSGLVTDESKLPSTFDGFEQLAQLIKSVKN